jgi:hypothetical protein
LVYFSRFGTLYEEKSGKPALKLHLHKVGTELAGKKLEGERFRANPVQGCQTVYFQTKNPNLGKNLVGLGMENAAILYDHLEYFLVTLCPL